MRDYAKLSPFFWTRGSGKRLRGDVDAMVVAMYLSTAPSANLIGIYYLPLVMLAHETGLTIDRARSALDRVEAAGYAAYDFDTETVWVPNLAKFEVGATLSAGDKRRHKVVAELERVGDHPFVARFWAIYGDAWGLGPCPVSASEMPHRRGIEGASKGHPELESRSDPDPSPIRSDSAPGPARTHVHACVREELPEAPPPTEAPAFVLLEPREVSAACLDDPLPDWARRRVDAVALTTGADLDAELVWAKYVAHRAARARPTSEPDFAGWVVDEAKIARRERERERDRGSGPRVVRSRRPNEILQPAVPGCWECPEAMP